MHQYYVIDKDRIVYRIIGEEAVILETRTGYSYSLNEAGTDIWKALDERLATNQILQRLTGKYDTSAEGLQRDMARFLKTLIEENLIEEGGPLRAVKAHKTEPRKEKKKGYEAPNLEKYTEIRRGRSVA